MFGAGAGLLDAVAWFLTLLAHFYRSPLDTIGIPAHDGGTLYTLSAMSFISCPGQMHVLAFND